MKKTRKVRLKDNREVTIRFLKKEDKDKLLEMFNLMSEEALKWEMPPYTEKVIERWIANIDHLIPLIAEYKSHIIGYGSIYKYPHPRRKGVGDLGMRLHQDFQNVGLGSAMLNLLLEFAQKEKLHRITLNVIADNKIALRLYEKFGFNVEGTMKDTYFGADKLYHDEIIMGKILKTKI
jgi:putative acetyltransferase